MGRRGWVGIGTGLILLILGVGAILSRKPSGSVEAIPGASRARQAASAVKAPEAGNARALFAQAERAFLQGAYPEAKLLYQQVLEQSPASEMAPAAQQRLGEVNLRLILSPAMTPDALIYRVQPGDTLTQIAKKFGTTVELLQAANGLTGDRIRPEQRLKVVKASFSLIVDKSQNSLALKNGEEMLKVYRCSTGAGGNTPIGRFKIINRLVDPPWYTPEGVIPHDDPRNVLGSRWMGFDQPGYGIHGTIDPSSIGQAVTQGCVRLVNSDVEELFILLPEGTPVTIVD